MAVVNIKNPNRFINPNLLDNWYFVGGGSQQGGGQLPINTRGQTSYSGSATYTIDRWRTTNSNTTVSIGINGLTISASSGSSPYLRQPIENAAELLGKKVTLSVLLPSGLKFITETLPSSNPSGTNVYANIDGIVDILYQSGVWSVRFKSTSGGSNTFIAVKLELGDTQTLCANVGGSWVVTEIPQYGEERLRCFRAMADSSDEYSHNPNAPIWSKTVSAEVNASGVMSFPTDVTIDNLISVYEESQGTGESLIAIPYKTTTSPATAAIRVYSRSSSGTLTPFQPQFSPVPKLTFVYRL